MKSMRSIFIRGTMNILLTALLIKGMFVSGGWIHFIYMVVVLLLLLDSMGNLGTDIEEKFLKHKE